MKMYSPRSWWAAARASIPRAPSSVPHSLFPSAQKGRPVPPSGWAGNTCRERRYMLNVWMEWRWRLNLMICSLKYLWNLQRLPALSLWLRLHFLFFVCLFIPWHHHHWLFVLSQCSGAQEVWRSLWIGCVIFIEFFKGGRRHKPNVFLVLVLVMLVKKKKRVCIFGITVYVTHVKAKPKTGGLFFCTVQLFSRVLSSHCLPF